MFIWMLSFWLSAQDAVLTRDQAEKMTVKELVQKVLSEFPHRHLYSAAVDKSMDGFPERPLSYISFEETGRAGGGRYCEARRLVAVFDTLHGKMPRDVEDKAVNAPRRLFTIGVTPLIAVRDHTATEAECAALRRYAQLPQRDPAAGRRAIEIVVDLSAQVARTGRSPVPVTCKDETAPGNGECDGNQALAMIDWMDLANVEQNRFDGSRQITLSFWGATNWHVELEGTDPVRALRLRRSYPAPF